MQMSALGFLRTPNVDMAQFWKKVLEDETAKFKNGLLALREFKKSDCANTAT